MKSAQLPIEAGRDPSRGIQMSWPEPLTAREWDERFPGAFDAVALLSGAANVIMQLGRPAVGYGVAESRVHSGSVMRHPIKRARTTFTYLSVALLGTSEEKRAYRHAVNQQHAQVRSTASSPVKYNAFDTDLQLWVAACLYYGFVDTMTKFGRELRGEQLDELYRILEPLATTLQVGPAMWPADRAAFERYWTEKLELVRYDAPVRDYLLQLIGVGPKVPIAFRILSPALRFFTGGFMPSEFREAMRYPWTERDQVTFDTATKAIGIVNRRLPRIVRQGPFLAVMWDFRRRRRLGLPLV